jgi:hypothetical protein
MLSLTPPESAKVKLRECTRSENNRNRDQSGQRWNGIEENLEYCVQKTPEGNYRVDVNRVSYGTFKTAEEANAVAKRVRLEINGAFDVSRRPEMYSDYEPGDLATVIDTDKAVKGRWYCPITVRAGCSCVKNVHNATMVLSAAFMHAAVTLIASK